MFSFGKRKKKKVALPKGWKRVASKSRPGEFSYVNQFTREKISWLPTIPASRTPGNPPPHPEDVDVQSPPRGRPGTQNTQFDDSPVLVKKKKKKGKKKGKAKAGKPPVAEAVEDSLPAGWKKSPSKSRPGEFSYLNMHTREKISWRPTVPASRTPGNPPPHPDDVDEEARVLEKYVGVLQIQ